MVIFDRICRIGFWFFMLASWAMIAAAILHNVAPHDVGFGLCLHLGCVDLFGAGQHGSAL